jgi:hypothetical protein
MEKEKVMKGMRALIIAGAIVCITATLSAEVYFENEAYPDGYFDDDPCALLDVGNEDNYWFVDVDNKSVVNISGGTVDWFRPFGSGTANISGGLTKDLDALGTSTINISGGEVWDLFASDQSEISITGGEVDWLFVSDDSEVAISQGQVTTLWAQGTSDVYIAGYELSYDPEFYWDSIRQVWQGSLTGVWLDETPFEIITWDEETYGHILEGAPGSPEPATIALLGLGCLAFVRKRRR